MSDGAIATAVALIKQFEGFRQKAYFDKYANGGKGIWTVGYGCTGVDRFGSEICEFTSWPEAFATEELRVRVNVLAARLESQSSVKLTDGQQAALISLAYNVGLAAVLRSKLWRKLQFGDPVSAADEFLDWNRAGGQVLAGLTARRKAEREVFLDGVISDVAEDNDSCSRDSRCSRIFGWFLRKNKNG